MKTTILLLLLVFLIGCGTGKDKEPQQDTGIISHPIPRTEPSVRWDTIITCDTVWTVVYDTTFKLRVPPIDTIVLPNTIKFGLMQASDDKAATKKLMQAAGINLIRLPFYFGQTDKGRVIDDFLNDGFNVQINFNYLPTYTPVPFPTDTTMIRQKAKAFFAYYQKWLKQIPFIVVENEWDNQKYRDWKRSSLKDYITELKIVCDEGHKLGFKIAGAGITGNTLGRWAYSKLSADSAKWWKDVAKYHVGLGKEYNEMVAMVDWYANEMKSINIDYLNTHWYNNRGRCSGGYPHAYNLWAKACGKPNAKRVNNEFGFRDGNMEIWQCTIQEMKDAGVVYAIAWSGDGSSPAERLTADMLKELR